MHVGYYAVRQPWGLAPAAFYAGRDPARRKSHARAHPAAPINPASRAGRGCPMPRPAGNRSGLSWTLAGRAVGGRGGRRRRRRRPDAPSLPAKGAGGRRGARAAAAGAWRSEGAAPGAAGTRRRSGGMPSTPRNARNTRGRAQGRGGGRRERGRPAPGWTGRPAGAAGAARGLIWERARRGTSPPRPLRVAPAAPRPRRPRPPWRPRQPTNKGRLRRPVGGGKPRASRTRRCTCRGCTACTQRGWRARYATGACPTTSRSYSTATAAGRAAT